MCKVFINYIKKRRMEKLQKRIVAQVWDLVHQIEDGVIDYSVILGYKIPDLAVSVLQNKTHHSHSYFANHVFRHLMENIGYYDMLPSPSKLETLTEDVINDRLYNPKANNIRPMFMPIDIVNGIRECVQWIEELNSAYKCNTDGSVVARELEFSKDIRQYVINIQPDYKVLYDNALAASLIGSPIGIAGKEFKILPTGSSIKSWKRNVTAPDEIELALSSFASVNVNPDNKSIYRYITAIKQTDEPFSLMQRYHYLSGNAEIDGVEVYLQDIGQMRCYACHSQNGQYLIVDSTQPLTARAMMERVFCFMVALGIITQTVYLDECWLFAYNDVDYTSCDGLMYQSLSPTSFCKYPIFTTNVFQYLAPIGREKGGKEGEKRAIQIIHHFNLSQALPIFPMDVFSRLVDVMIRYECVCRGSYILLSGTDYPLEVQPGVFAVALEVISNVKNLLMGEESKFIAPPELFDSLQIKETVSKILDEAKASGCINEVQHKGMSTRTEQLNEAFNSDKLRFMLEKFNYPLSAEDNATLKIRNPLLHGSINIKNKYFKKYGESGALFKVALMFHKLSLSVPLLMAGYHGYIINNAKAYGFDNTCKSFIKIGHWDNKMLDNQTGRSIIDTFDEYYSDAFFGICNLLEKFKIKVVDSVNYEVPEVFEGNADAEGDEPLRNFIQKDGYDASTTDATIVIDFALCEKIGIKGNLLLAALAHEVGHLIFYFLNNKEMYDKEAEEMKADSYAKRVHLDIPLKEVLNLLRKSERYPSELCEQMQRRIDNLNQRGLYI